MLSPCVAKSKGWRKGLRPASQAGIPQEIDMIKVGDKLPEATLSVVTPEKAEAKSTAEIFGGKTVALFASLARSRRPARPAICRAAREGRGIKGQRRRYDRLHFGQ